MYIYWTYIFPLLSETWSLSFQQLPLLSELLHRVVYMPSPCYLSSHSLFKPLQPDNLGPGFIEDALESHFHVAGPVGALLSSAADLPPTSCSWLLLCVGFAHSSATSTLLLWHLFTAHPLVVDRLGPLSLIHFSVYMHFLDELF